MLITLFEQSTGRNIYLVHRFKRQCTIFLIWLSYHQTARNLQDTNSVERRESGRM